MQVSKPLFSIIIPTYNRANLIETAINSILTQGYSDWELIIVDDGSTDDTQSVVAKYLTDKRINYYYQENKELNGARNTGIDLSTGTYLCFCDDDDYYLPNHLELLEAFIKEHNEPIGLIRMGTFYQRGAKMIKLPNYDKEANNPFEFIWKNPVNLLSIAMHRTIFERQRFDEDFLLYEDVHFLFRVILDFPFYQDSNYTAVYVNHSGARTINYRDAEKVKNYFACMDHLFDNFGERLTPYITPTMRQEAVTLQYLNFSKAATMSRDFSNAAKYIWSAMRNGRSIPLFRNFVYSIGLLLSKWMFNYPKLPH